MKGRVLKIVFATSVAFLLSVSAMCQNYYLVIGAFATEKDDIKEITSYLPGNAADTAYTIRRDNSLLHFYVMKTSDKERVMAKSRMLQEEISKENKPDKSFRESPVRAAEIKSQNFAASDDDAAAPASEMVGGSAPGGHAARKPSGKLFRFTIQRNDGQSIQGTLHQIDPIRGKELNTFETDSYIDILKPGQNRPMSVVCSVFGYKEVEKFIDYSSPWLTEGAFVDDKGAWVIPYTLENLERGDVAQMRNVIFYKDAVIMLPQAKADLDALVAMMKANPRYEIRVHAHCNGKHDRKVISLGKENNFFDVNGSSEIEASAKQLTQLRGEAVRLYLKTQGIDESRIKTYSWGGSDMLVRQTDPNSKVNDRVEIEVLKD